MSSGLSTARVIRAIPRDNVEDPSVELEGLSGIVQLIILHLIYCDPELSYLYRDRKSVV